MINKTLYKYGLKSNFKLFLIFFAIIFLYIAMIIPMYDPKLANLLDDFIKMMPELMAMMGMISGTTTLIGFLINYLYGFIFTFLPFLFFIILIKRLITSYIDSGSLSYLLSSANNRTKIIFTQLLVLITFIFILTTLITLSIIVISEISFNNELDVIKLLNLNISLFIFYLAISSITFASTIIFKESKNSILIGAGIPLLFFVIQMLVNLGDKLAFLKYFTIFTLFNPINIIEKEKLFYIIILLTISIILYWIAIKIFKKRDFFV